jgi:hypothetical protein
MARIDGSKIETVAHHVGFLLIGNWELKYQTEDAKSRIQAAMTFEDLGA